MSVTPIYKEHAVTPVTMFATETTPDSQGRYYVAGQPVALYGDDMFGPLDGSTHTEAIGYLDHDIGPFLATDRVFATSGNAANPKRMAGSVWVRYKRSRWVKAKEAVVAGDVVVYDTDGSVKKATSLGTVASTAVTALSAIAGVVRIGGEANATVVIFTE